MCQVECQVQSRANCRVVRLRKRHLWHQVTVQARFQVTIPVLRQAAGQVMSHLWSPVCRPAPLQVRGRATLHLVRPLLFPVACQRSRLAVFPAKDRVMFLHKCPAFRRVTHQPFHPAEAPARHQALYLRDPDNNGVELYWDRDPAEWPRDADGNLSMSTDRLDLDALLAEA